MKPITALFLILILSGCTSYTRMNRTTFAEPSFSPGGTIYVVAANRDKDNTLEFKHFKPMIEQYLRQFGYQPVESLKQAKSVAIISYGIDNGQIKTIVSPIYGYDAFNNYSVIIPGYPIPTYSVVGLNTVEYSEYTHVLSMEIVDAKTLKSKNIKQLYTSKVISKGPCPMITPVFPNLLAGLFTDFPGQNAETRYIRIPETNSCDQDSTNW